MTSHAPQGQTKPCPVNIAEHLVVDGFRYWNAGFDTGQIECWELARKAYENALDPQLAKRALGELSTWVRTSRKSAGRQFETLPYGCLRLCRDECAARRLIAACQHNDEQAKRDAALDLVGEHGIQAAIRTAQDLADVLSESAHILTTNTEIPQSCPFGPKLISRITGQIL
ncbi:MAG: hypothetical protein JKY49_12865 [Cohaesibacteraceae bacterium]|nr:hypothetical protein [Cohaesibacteraceae bacterium]